MFSEQLRSENEIIKSWKGNITNPTVSVKCTTFNHALYIEDAIKSFLSQITDFPIEIWIHDDASTDGTSEIINKYCSLYPKIINAICQTENQYSKGVKVGRLLGKYCKGEYIALCEGDDYWVGSDKLANQLEAMKRNPSCDLCIHPGIMLDVRNNVSYKKYWHGNKEKVIDVAPIAASLSQFAPTASYFYKRTAYEELPEWLVNSKKLPFGDYFVETVIGKNGVIYIPHYSCVYRRNVAGSYTVRTQVAKPDVLIARLAIVVEYTSKLYEVPEIPNKSVSKRLKVVHEDYLNMAVTRQSYNMAQSVIKSAHKALGDTTFGKSWKWRSATGFYLYSFALIKYRKVKGLVKSTLA